MAKVKVYNMQAKEVGQMNLNDDLFAVEYNEPLIHEVIVAYNANQRQGTKSALTRSEVRGHAKKPWRQKGTGHARQGSIRSPQWTHGGVALGPKPRDYSYHINRKVKRLAILSALSAKAAAGDMIVIDNLSVAEYKTKTVVNMLNAVGASKKALIVTPVVEAKLVKSAANIPGVVTTVATSVNTYDVVNADKFIVSVDAAKKLEEVLG